MKNTPIILLISLLSTDKNPSGKYDIEELTEKFLDFLDTGTDKGATAVNGQLNNLIELRLAVKGKPAYIKPDLNPMFIGKNARQRTPKKFHYFLTPPGLALASLIKNSWKLDLKNDSYKLIFDNNVYMLVKCDSPRSQKIEYSVPAKDLEEIANSLRVDGSSKRNIDLVAGISLETEGQPKKPKSSPTIITSMLLSEGKKGQESLIENSNFPASNEDLICAIESTAVENSLSLEETLNPITPNGIEEINVIYPAANETTTADFLDLEAAKILVKKFG